VERVPGANRLREQCERIRTLGACEPDTAARAEIDAALVNKWWGVRIVAIATLGRWGDARAFARLRTILESNDDTRGWGSWERNARDAAFKALGECLPASETAWALETYLIYRDGAALIRPLAREPAVFWEAVIAEEWRRDDPYRLERLIGVLREVPADAAQRRGWQARFCSHPHTLVRRMAGYAWPNKPRSER
jgi:hypothetical protein